MTLQEAYALSAERQDNLAYRKKIQRIKNTILGVIGGAGLGLGMGMLSNVSSRVNESPLDRLLRPGGRRSGKMAPALGMLAGAAVGGLGGYGLTRLKETYDESAGLDPTLLNVVVNRAPEVKSAAAASRLMRFIPYTPTSYFYQLADKSPAVRSGLEKLTGAAQRGIESKALKALRLRWRKGLPPLATKTSLLTDLERIAARRGAMASVIRKNPDIFREVRKALEPLSSSPFSDIAANYVPISSLTAIAK